MRHTPGPWSLQGRIRIEAGKGAPETRKFIADMKTHRLGSADRVPQHNEQEANTHLIAAAPELLVACQRLVPWIGKMIANNQHMESVLPNDAVRSLEMGEAAIAKAEGR